MITIDAVSIFTSIFTSLFGMAYFIYGKKTTSFIFMITGGILVFYSYFVPNPYWNLFIGLSLVALPHLVNRYY